MGLIFYRSQPVEPVRNMDSPGLAFPKVHESCLSRPDACPPAAETDAYRKIEANPPFTGRLTGGSKALEIADMTNVPNEAAGRRSGLLDAPGTSLLFAEVAFRGDTHRLARLLVDDLAEREEWSDVELGSMLAHQLNAPLDAELAMCDRRRPDPITGTIDIARTFSQVLFGEAGSVDLLRRIKEYAKSHLVRKDPCYPVEISRVLYYGSVLAARRLYGERITSLSHTKCRSGVDWVLSREWIEPTVRAWFRASLAYVTDPE
jgi:hypothetical protein